MRIKTQVPAVDFGDSVASVGGLFNREQQICHANREFHGKIQRDFHKHQSQAQTRKRVKGVAGRTKYEYWPQQLHFAVWYATTGYCGLAREIFLESGKQLSSQLRAFFHSKTSPTSFPGPIRPYTDLEEN